MTTMWYEGNPDRFLLERGLLKRFYPRARLVLRRGTISAFLRIAGRRRRGYVVRIDYPPNFPSKEPAAFPVEPRITGTPHQYTKGRLCLHGPSEVGPQTTGKVIADWCVDWIRDYEAWLASGRRRWPRGNQTR